MGVEVIWFFVCDFVVKWVLFVGGGVCVWGIMVVGIDGENVKVSMFVC